MSFLDSLGKIVSEVTDIRNEIDAFKQDIVESVLKPVDEVKSTFIESSTDLKQTATEAADKN